MPKRMTATERWENPWYRSLEPRLKCLWEYALSKCDCAGIWNADFELASFQIGATVTEADIEKLGGRIERLPDGKFWIVNFVEFQWGGKFPKAPKVRDAVVSRLQRYELVERVSKGFEKPLERVQEKAKEKAKAKEIVKAEIPTPLNTPLFLETWSKWEIHRQQIRKPLTPQSVKEQMTQFVEWGVQRAIAAINYSIAKGWQGIYEEKQNGQSSKTAGRPNTDADHAKGW